MPHINSLRNLKQPISSYIRFIFFLIAFSFLLPSIAVAQTAQQLSAKIQSLLEESKFEELLEILGAAPEGISAVDLYLLRSRALTGLGRNEEALKQVQAGQRIAGDSVAFSLAILELYLLLGQFDNAEKLIAKLKSNPNIKSRLDSYTAQMGSMDGYTFSLIPDVALAENITNEISDETRLNLQDFGRNIPAPEVTNGWSLGLSLSTTFINHTSLNDYFLTAISASTNTNRGIAFSSLKTNKYTSNSGSLYFQYNKQISPTFSLSPSVSYSRSNSPKDGVYSSNNTSFQFGFISIINSNIRLGLSPRIGYSFYDNPQKSRGFITGMSTRLNWSIRPIGGGRASVGSSILFQQYSYKPKTNGRSLTNLGLNFNVHPKNVINLHFSFNPSISYSQFNGLDSLNKIPRVDLSYGLTTVVTLAMAPLYNNSFFPTITINMSQTNSTIKYVQGSNLSFSLGVSDRL